MPCWPYEAKQQAKVEGNVYAHIHLSINYAASKTTWGGVLASRQGLYQMGRDMLWFQRTHSCVPRGGTLVRGAGCGTGQTFIHSIKTHTCLCTWRWHACQEGRGWHRSEGQGHYWLLWRRWRLRQGRCNLRRGGRSCGCRTRGGLDHA